MMFVSRGCRERLAVFEGAAGRVPGLYGPFGSRSAMAESAGGLEIGVER